MGELTSARAGLVAALDASGRDEATQQAARAQRMFDCWLDEQEENIQRNDIASCRDDFRFALGKVQQALVKAPAPQPAAAPWPAPPTRDYLVFFDFDRSDVRPDSAQILDEVVASFGALNASTISLVGFTDLAGSNDYNQNLSDRRTVSKRVTTWSARASARLPSAAPAGARMASVWRPTMARGNRKIVASRYESTRRIIGRKARGERDRPGSLTTHATPAGVFSHEWALCVGWYAFGR